MTASDEAQIAWTTSCTDEIWAFARKCAELKDSNPFEFDALDYIMSCFMTELWDNFFSQSEIGVAFEKAIAELPRYAAGEERRR